MKKLLTLDIILVFILFVWGSLVRVNGAGLACPDWPLCHGKIIPPFDTLILLEWGHRLIASLVGFLTLGIGIKVFMSKPYRQKIGWLVGIALPLLIVQVILGGLTVKQLLHPYFVTVHVAVGTLFFSCLVIILLKLSDAHYVISAKASVIPAKAGIYILKMWTGVITFLIFGQIILGTLVSSSHAGLACPDFPLCLGQWIPPLIGTVAYHFFHRIMAYVIFLAIAGLWIFSGSSGDPKFKISVKVLLMLVCVQVGLGILNVVFQLPLPIRVVHLAMAMALFSMALVTTYKVSYARLS